MMTEAKIRVTYYKPRNAKDYPQPPEVRRGKEGYNMAAHV